MSKSAVNTPARAAGSSHRTPPGAEDGLAVIAAVAGSSRGNALASTAASAAAYDAPAASGGSDAAQRGCVVIRVLVPHDHVDGEGQRDRLARDVLSLG